MHSSSLFTVFVAPSSSEQKNRSLSNIIYRRPTSSFWCETLESKLLLQEQRTKKYKKMKLGIAIVATVAAQGKKNWF